MFSPETINEDTIVEIAQTLNKNSFEKLLELLDEFYHNDESLVSDRTYDELVDIYEAKYTTYKNVGFDVIGEKVKLPYYLGSLRKLKEAGELSTWMSNYKGPYIIEDKIDGLTLLYISKGKAKNLYTRGDGNFGKDVSHLIPYLNLPDVNVSVRGEVVLTKTQFNKIGKGFKNPRNLVSGIVNKKKQFELADKLSFYAYHIMDKDMKPEEEILELQQMGFLTPSPVSSQHLTKEMLEHYFNERKKEAPYEVDGLVIYNDKATPYPVSDKPKHVVAFKTLSESKQTTVIKVVWRASKGKLLKPTVYFEMINLSGADLQKASGYNARFIINNNIGPNSKIVITRSGDVIPKIIKVVQGTSAQLPDSAIPGEYAWNENEVEFVLVKENDEVAIGKIKHFLETLDVKNFGRKRIESIVKAGINTIDELIKVSPSQLEQIDGIGSGLSEQVCQDIREKITNVSLAKIMDASNIFPGIGERRFEAIIAVYPNLLEFASLNKSVISDYIRQVKGFNSLADDISENLAIFVDWLANTSIRIKDPSIKSPKTSGKVEGLTIVFSGFRDKDLEDKIKMFGGKVTTSVSKNTSLLVIKDINPENIKGKAIEAQTKGVPLITREDFVSKYL